MTVSKISLALATALVSSNSFAVLKIDVPFVSTSAKHEQSNRQNLAPVVVINRKQIEQSSANDVSDLLRFYAGLDIAKTGGDGSSTSLFIRGANSAQVLVLVDGVKINSASAGGAALQFISPDMIERIELVKGPRSSLYGSEAVGGVLNIITRKNTAGLNVTLGAGSLDTTKFGFNAGFKQDLFDGTVTVSQYKTAGYVDNSLSTEKHAFENLSVQARVGANIGNSRVDLHHTQANGDSEYYGYNTNISGNSELAQKNTNKATSLHWVTKVNSIWTSKLIYGVAQDKNDQKITADYYYTDRTYTDFQNDLQLSKNNLLTIGLSSDDDKVTSIKYNQSVQVDSIYIQDDVTLGSHHLIVAVRSLNSSSFGKHTTYNVDYGFDISPTLTVGFGIGTAFKAPSLNELYYPYYGNLSIKPEESENKEWFLNYQIDNNQKLKLAVFDNQVKNLIAYDSSTFKAGNIDQASLTGSEINYQYQSSPWQLQVGYINQKPIDVSTGGLLRRRAEQSFTALMGYDKNNLSMELSLLSTSARTDGTNKPLASYNLINIQSAYRFNRNMQLSLKIDNLADEQYETAYGYPAKGQTLFVELKYNQ